MPGRRDIVVCTQALRDEGLSRHYLAPARYARPALSSRLHHDLRALGLPAHTGAAWSADAPYRETAQEIAQGCTEGILVADMEAAAVFAVAERRGAAAAAVFVSPPSWKTTPRWPTCSRASPTPTPASPCAAGYRACAPPMRRARAP
ncbi:hypothetical protein ACH4FX_42955 [Streptomyces sp. NPDC018019]|uniref:phosphorylase family protein n=1 Tax=Streptomyces sp. NPDC018019 TaxID=3365030 RepID=UPI00378CB565